ncbi:MAG: PQQ-binding-like beta-propeller repeat protein [Planctomycetota bacterium]
MAALERALEFGDRGGLASVARRWPLTDASQRLWGLGDLEVERGEVEDGLRAWARGAALALAEPERVTAGKEGWLALRAALDARANDAAGRDSRTIAGARARVAFALSLFDDEGRLETAAREPVASFLDGAAPGALIQPDGFGDEGWADPWRPAQTPGANPFYDLGANMRVFGARDASGVYINTSRAVYAIGAFSGATLWSFGPEELGWSQVPSGSANDRNNDNETTLSEFSRAIDSENQLIAPAVARGVVVASVQLPIAYEKRDQFNRIKIIDVIPERRLVGLDARTGAKLWDGFPPAGWDGDSGDFDERMTVVGPPTIIGSRVLAPLARQRGRIEFHLGCFDLETGATLWSTRLVTGQVPLNMFGRQVREFSAPPVVVRGGTVVVQSNLGVIAAVDLFTGDTLWESVYEQIPIQAPTYYDEGVLRSRWRNAPPVVVGGIAIATPVDCSDLIGVDLATGALRWSISHAGLFNGQPQRRTATDLLVGADTQRVYLYVQGRDLVALRADDSLERGAPTRFDWRREDSNRSVMSRTDPAMPALDGEFIYLPGADSLTVVERKTGRVVREIPGDLGSGNLLVSHGALVAVSADNVTAAFEWRGMVLRAEAAATAAPDDPQPAAELARLYLVRADHRADNGDTSEAERLYRAANGVLTARGADATGAPAVLREPLFQALVGEARLARRALDPARAEERLRAALAVAPSPALEREALLGLYAVQRARAVRAAPGSPEERALDATLTQLAGQHGDVVIGVAFQPATPWAPGGVDDVAPDPWLGALVPDDARLGGRARRSEFERGDAPGARAKTTVALWVELERLGEVTRRNDAPAEAALLFGLLRRFGDADLPGGLGIDVRSWATGRLNRLRRSAPAEVFAPYEAQANALLDDARSDVAPDGKLDRDRLARIAELFPGTSGARRANDLRLEVAVERGEVEEVARIVLDPLPRDSSLPTLNERELRLTLRLASAFGARGNLALRAGLTERIAAVRPGLTVDLPQHRGSSIEALAERWRADALEPPAPRATATQAATPTEILEGDFAFIGQCVDQDKRALALFWSEASLIALRPGERTGKAWELPLGSDREWHVRRSRAVVQGGLVHLAGRSDLSTVRAADGTPTWSWPAGEGRVILQIVHSDGVLIARTRPEYADGSELVIALDAASGIELWRRATPAGTSPVAGGGRLVLVLENNPRAEVIDLFLGGRERTLEVGQRRNISGGEGWITEGQFVLPQFLRDDDPQRNQIEAFDLDTGARTWRVDLGKHRGAPHVLMSVLEYAEPGAPVRRLMVLRPINGASNVRTVHLLNERLGALDRAALVELRDRAEFVDMAPSGLTRLDSPLFFIATEPLASGEATTLRAVDVRLGTLWNAALPRPSAEASQPRLMTPLVAEDTVVVPSLTLVRTRRPGLSAWELTFYDRRTGELRESRPMPREAVRWNEIVGVGSALFLGGIDRLDRLETPR